MSGKQAFRVKGFTLVELMIVVAIIGILASVAIPSFVNYQLTAKRSEGFSNLASLAKAQKAYFAEFSDFVAVEPEPWFTSGVLPTTITRDSAPMENAYLDVGWVPEGNVYFDYDTAKGGDPLNGNCGACTEGCFTSSAYGDLDGDGLYSILILAHPNPTGDFCTTGRAAGGGPWIPPLGPDGTRVFDSVARVTAADDF